MHLSWRTHCETGSVSLAHAHSQRACTHTGARLRSREPACTRCAREREEERKREARCSQVQRAAPLVCVCARTMQLRSRAPSRVRVYVNRRVGTGPTRGPEARSNSRTVDTDLTQRPAAVHTVPLRCQPPRTPFLSPYTARQKSRKNSLCLQSATPRRRRRERRCASRTAEILRRCIRSLLLPQVSDRLSAGADPLAHPVMYYESYA